ncbi:MAG: hypothetical protein MJY50_00150 [Bacteroidales bacterium]|nr:hypothetical protein [Bacteroidales bacterium]
MDNLDLSTVFARNCEVRRIDRARAAAFMDSCHRMGSATCRHCYGLFIKRRTGGSETELECGTMVAAATFSNARRWRKGDVTVASYEWIRYASLPGIRVTGGMGKLLNAFVEEVGPDDVMSYCDLGWSDGDAYRELGFTQEGVVERTGFRCLKFRKTFPTSARP